jgi:2-dehydropantoate 2-reductase
MRFALIGVGDIGSRYAGKIALAGHDVLFISRGERLKELQTSGLRIGDGALGDAFSIPEVDATDNVEGRDPVDAIIFGVKTYHLPEAAEQVKPIVGPDTLVIPLQNGVDAPGRIGDVVGREHMLGYATYSPNYIGELDGPVSDRLRDLHTVLVDAGWNVETTDNIWQPLWTKMCAYASFSPFIVARLSPGDSYRFETLRELHQQACEEVAAVGQAEGFEMSAKQLVDFAQVFPNSKQSMTRDLENGRPLEVEDLIGRVVRAANEHGIDAPAITSCYQLLKPYENGSIQQSNIQ